MTLMILAWGVGCIPLAIIGFTDQLWVMVIALFVCGFIFSGAQVLWGTLLQRRVPHALLGRVSSLDFFVSLALMPVSMALAGPLGEAVGIAPAFLFAGLVPTVLAVGDTDDRPARRGRIGPPDGRAAESDEVAEVAIRRARASWPCLVVAGKGRGR